MCLTGSVGRIRNEAASAVLFEQEGRSDKILRVTLPLIVQIGPGTRLTVDQGDPANRPYVFCLANGCAADFTATDELIGKLKNGRYMFVQAIDVAGQGFSWTVPVSDFNKAYEGLPTDPRKFKSIYESPPKPWKDDTLQPHLRPGNK
jgi:invasion protein IalB